MWYIVVRILFFSLVFVAAFLLIKRSKIIRKKKFAMAFSLLLCMILCSASSLLPVENLFVHFASPQDVFRYTGNGEIEDMIYGKDSCLLMTSDSVSFIPKSNRGYQIATAFSSKTVANIFDKNGGFKIDHVSGTDDFYLWGNTVSKGNDFSISDSGNSDIKTKFIQNEDTGYHTVLVYGLINGYTDDYFVVINDEKLLFTPC